ncbi:MAG: aldolase/citrate lyase family protein [Vulcanimicrobiaceae bacterium]|jgi:4-hydroxy-2-oxoheptanedioate aldolase
MIDNHAKAALRADRPVLAITVNFVHPGLAEYLARLGFGCLVIDAEHGAVNDAVLENVVRAAELGGAITLLRLPVNDPLMQRYLGIGVAGFHVPQVGSAAAARAAIDAIKFAPAGHRGLGSFRAADFGLSLGTWPDYMRRANENTLVIVAIEDPDGVAALPELVAMPEIDVVLIGTSDLSASLGFPGQTKHPAVLEIVDRAIGTIRAAGKTVGLPASSAADIREVYDRGARFILTSVARALPVGTNELLGTMRGLAS